eukprot:5198605-Prorocentrum_lima.AAC.1
MLEQQAKHIQATNHPALCVAYLVDDTFVVTAWVVPCAFTRAEEWWQQAGLELNSTQCKYRGFAASPVQAEEE